MRLLPCLLLLLYTGCAGTPEKTPEQRRDRAFAFVVQGVDRQLQGDNAGAERAFQAAVGLVPSSPTIHKRLAQVQLARQKRELGLGHLRAAVQATAADDVQMLVALTRLAADNGQQAIALTLAAKLARIPQAEPRELAAQVFAREGKWDQVTAVYQALVDAAVPAMRGRMLIRHADLLRRYDRNSQAAAIYGKALGLPNTPRRLPLEAARCEARAGRVEQAFALLERFAATVGELEPRETLFKAQLLFLLGRPTQAEQLLQPLLQAQQLALEVRLLWARQLARQTPEQALAMLAPLAREQEPENLGYYLLRGRLEHTLGRRERARKTWRRGALQFPESALPLIHLAGSWQSENELDLAQVAYEAALLREPTSGPVLYALGRFHLEAQGEAASAVDYLEQAVRRVSGMDVWIDLARALLRSGRHARSVALLRRLLDRRQDARIWRCLGIALLALGDRKGAVRAWQISIRLRPDAVLRSRVAALQSGSAKTP